MGLKIYKQAGLLAGGTVTGPILLPDGTRTAPALAWDADANTGFFSPADDTIGIATAGTDRVIIGSSGMGMGSGRSFGWMSADVNLSGATFDTILARDAANTLALRNATNAQRLNVYNTDSGANDELWSVDWQTTANVVEVGAKATGTGVVRPMRLTMAPSVVWRTGAGTPEGSVTAAVGSLYTRTDGGAGTTLYVKESGAGNTGWVAK